MKNDEWVETVLDEARQHGRTPVPLDQAALEARLMARLAAGEGTRFPPVGPPRPAPWRLAAGGVLVVSGLAALWAILAGPIVTPVAPLAALTASAPAPVAAAVAGRRWLTGGAGAPVLESAGLATVWLEPAGQGWADEREGRLRFELTAGAVALDVVPQRQPDRVEVIAGGTRVVVKGTRFRVARQGERVEVDVEHGTVLVAPVDDPSASVTLVGPSGGSFGPGPASPPRSLRSFATGLAAHAATPVTPPASASPGSAALDGTPTAGLDGAPAPASTRPVDPAGSVSAAGKGRPVVGSVDLPGRAFSLVSSCLSSSSSTAPGVVVTIATTLAVDIDARGRATALSFSPPLAPAVEQCTRRSLDRLGGAPGHHKLPLSLSLGGR